MKVANTVQGTSKLSAFLESVLPEEIPPPSISPHLVTIKSRDAFIKSVEEGVRVAPMVFAAFPPLAVELALLIPLDRPFV